MLSKRFPSFLEHVGRCLMGIGEDVGEIFKLFDEFGSISILDLEGYCDDESLEEYLRMFS